MNIVLLGPPGAGKGTQANNLAKEFNLVKVSSGDLLREEIKKKGLMSNEIKSIINDGLFVSDNIINDLIEKVISFTKNKNRLIFDGYPRNLEQTKNLDFLLKKYGQKVSKALILDVDENNIVKRVLGRQICSKCNLTFNEYFNPSTSFNHNCDKKFLLKRSDDNETTIKKRFQTYTKETLPILNYYKSQNLLTKIDGMNKIDVIYKEIRQIISSLSA